MIGLVTLVLALGGAPAKPCAAPEATASTSATATTAPAEPPVGVPGQPGECVDATLQEQLLAKRRHRLTKDRLFVKALRHELNYVSDLFDSTFTVGGSYTYFMSENFGAEIQASWSRLRTSVANTIEEANAFDLALGNDDIVRVFGSLLWSPLYGKLRLIAASIWRYDLYFLAGPGVVVDPISFGAAGNFGVGFRVFLHRGVALRFEFRDVLYRQEILDEDFTVNDVSFTTGLSVLLPMRN
jgi:outer membrane beta-barrel protein